MLEVSGDMTVRTAAMRFEIGGTERGLEYDAVDVGGLVDLGGALSVSFLSDFETLIASTDEFEILRASAGFIGSIGNAGDGMRLMTEDELGSFLVSYRTAPSGGMSLVLGGYRPIPEPTTALLIALGIAALGARPRTMALRGEVRRNSGRRS